ncbi:BQ2448_2197 [Microbotryum intermedium]|uniref:BQ2448_2197 protein n=1 Tax=Microbotryum intermedium TaxID=269621 RepID=A0A238F7Q0_9BASI|nr:BQ2448_2197 [Microbotryum intermedium]
MATEAGGQSSPPPPPSAPTASTPAPSTPGVIGGASSTSSRSQRWQQSRVLGAAKTGWAWRRAILFGLGTTYAVVRWQSSRIKARKRDQIHDKTYLYWKIYDGGIVEAKSYGSNLNYLLNSSTGSPEEPQRVMTLFDVIRTIKLIEQDDRIRGIIADFSNISVPSVPAYNLGLAQLEEIQDALLELRCTKHERLGQEAWKTIAWSDTFTSQAQYLFASCFDEVYTQPTGEVPLVGMGTTLPFFGRLAKWLGVDVHAEARNEYKSFVQPYIDEKLTKPQKENQLELVNDLNDHLMTYIARNRFSTTLGLSGLEHVKKLSQEGPYSSTQATKVGLLNGTAYRQDVIDSIMDKDENGEVIEDPKRVKGFYHYSKIMERIVEKTVKDVMDVGVVYLMGTIGDTGEFGTAAVVRGLKEAGEDDSIGAVVLRIDSGGGGVVESDTIWAAVRDLREKYGKTVVASFGNASASGGYLVSTHADAILASPSTITGSIGVAALRPTFTQTFFDRIHITLDSIFLGSRTQDLTHKLEGAELKRWQAHVDEMYADFKNRVVEGRCVNPELIDLIAGGRVYAGLKAFELTAPKELIDKIRGWSKDDPKAAEVTSRLEEVSTIATATEEDKTTAGSNRATIMALPEDQETSPFAPPTTVVNEVVAEEVASLESAEVNALKALSSPEPISNPAPPTDAKSSPLSTVSGVYEITPGPFGRGLIDGLGGIRDSAIYACELFISNGMAAYQLENPGMSDKDALKSLLPEARPSWNEGTGEMVMSLDVRLKRFPVQKGFWQSVREASEKGDSFEVKQVGGWFKGVLVGWMMKALADGVSDELRELGLWEGSRQGTSGLGLGKTRMGGSRGIRAEWGGFNLR